MKKMMNKLLLTLLFLLLCAAMLLDSKRSLYYAMTGLQLWFQKMIPALLPFMILSNLLIGLNLTGAFVSFLQPFFGRLFSLNGYGVYVLFIGFLCGFPMGAKVTADLLKQGRLSERDASYLLAFCNNIGPIYFTGFVLLVLEIDRPFPYLFGMYGLPFLYGLLLRRLPAYRPQKAALSQPCGCRLCAQSEACLPIKKASDSLTLLDVLDDAIMSGLSAITRLGGYMVFFNLLNLLPDMLFRLFPFIFAGRNTKLLSGAVNCLLEITSGISRLGSSCPLLVLTLLPFGGFSCIAQTYSMIKGSGLSIVPYVFHKIILTGITLCYYLLLGPLLKLY